MRKELLVRVEMETPCPPPLPLCRAQMEPVARCFITPEAPQIIAAIAERQELFRQAQLNRDQHDFIDDDNPGL